MIKIIQVTQWRGCGFGSPCEYAGSRGGCTFKGYCKFQF